MEITGEYVKTYANYAIQCFEEILTERMHETEYEFLRNEILDSVSNAILIEWDGVKEYINRDEYSLGYLVHHIVNCLDDGGIVYIDGKDPYDWD